MAKREIKSVSVEDLIKKKRKVRLLASLVGLVLVFIGASYLVMKTEVLKTTGVDVSGARIVDEELIRAQASVSYIFNTVSLEELPVAVQEVDVSRNFFTRKIKVSVTEREQYGQWCNSDFECFWFDREGVLFFRAPRASGSLVRVVTSPYIISEGDTVLPQRFLGNFLSILNLLDDLDLRVSNIEIENLAQQEMTVYASNYNVPVMFSLRDDPEFTRDALNKLKEDFGRLSYIDLRSSNRAFYRYK